jgi:alanyl-tRNA synthetase
LHVDLTPDGDTRGALVNKDDPRCIEIWNLVFIQFNADTDGNFTPLPQRHVDTGMGFERTTAIIQGTKNFTDFSGTISNYETDIFRLIFDEIEKLSGKKYASTLPKTGGQASSLSRPAGFQPVEKRTNDGQDAHQPGQARSLSSEQEKIDIAFRVVADHIRTLSFAIADGIQPGNTDRNYVLRRILRRAVRYGRTLGFHEPFFYKLVAILAKTMGDVFPEICAKQKHVEEVLKREEEAFNKTLDRGLEIFETYIRGLISAVERSSVVKSQFLVNESGNEGFVERYAAYLPTTRFGQPSGWDVISGYSRFEDQYPAGMHALMGKLHEAKSLSEAISLVEAILSASTTIAGDFAFKLYDTYGFPLDLTELMARERGLTVDVAGFEKLMDQQRERARKAQKKAEITVTPIWSIPTKFVGYDQLEADATLAKLIRQVPAGDDWGIVDVSPFYAEMGGQVGDTGSLIFLEDGHVVTVTNTLKNGDSYYLKLDGLRDHEPEVRVRLVVDMRRRRAVERHHTVTHLLHWALHEVVSRDAVQKGSYVGPDKLTFDFSSAALTAQQKRDVEKLVNEKVLQNASVSWTEIPYTEAKQRSDIQQFFGDKYGETVRVVQIGGQPNGLNGYSMELCGGTHVRATAEIGSFRIVREEAIAAGIRRIEAVAGDAARTWAQQEASKQQEKFEALARKKPDIAALPVFTTELETKGMLESVDARAAHLEKLEAEVREWEKQSAKEAGAEMQSRAATIANELAESHAGKTACVALVREADGKLLQAVVDALKTKFSGPIFLAGAMGGRVSLIAAVPKELTSKFQAGKLIQEIAPIVGGRGGGRPELAQGGGTDVTKIEEALAKARDFFESGQS